MARLSFLKCLSFCALLSFSVGDNCSSTVTTDGCTCPTGNSSTIIYDSTVMTLDNGACEYFAYCNSTYTSNCLCTNSFQTSHIPYSSSTYSLNSDGECICSASSTTFNLNTGTCDTIGTCKNGTYSDCYCNNIATQTLATSTGLYLNSDGTCTCSNVTETIDTSTGTCSASICSSSVTSYCWCSNALSTMWNASNIALQSSGSCACNDDVLTFDATSGSCSQTVCSSSITSTCYCSNQLGVLWNTTNAVLNTDGTCGCDNGLDITAIGCLPNPSIESFSFSIASRIVFILSVILMILSVF